MRDKIITVIKDNLVEIIPELEGQPIDLDESLVDLGANSLDRGELIMLTLEHFNLDVSRIEFVLATTGNELADLFCEKMEAVNNIPG